MLKIIATTSVETAATPDLNTLPGLTKFLTDAGFSKRIQQGNAYFSKKGTMAKVLKALEANWSFQKTIDSKTLVTFELSNKIDPDVKLYANVSPAFGSSFNFKVGQFKTADKVNIYNVDKHHPAYAWVQDSLDLHFTGPGIKATPEARKKVIQDTVDEYMRESGLTPEALAIKIAERTKTGTVHKYFG